MYYGNKSICNYATEERNFGKLEMPFIKVESPDAKLRFRYHRQVEYNPLRNADELRVVVVYKMSGTVLWSKDSREPSEKAWVLSPELPLGDWVGKEVRVIFQFDTKDELDNNYAGVAIDNVEIIGAKWSPWAETSGEVILNWTGGLPKYFVYRGTSPDFTNNPPELRAYTPFNNKYENSLNDHESYYYKIR